MGEEAAVEEPEVAAEPGVAPEEVLAKYEQELEDIKAIAGMSAERCPLRWIKWETDYRDKGARTPTWKRAGGELGYLLASLHDAGVVCVLVKGDGTCVQVGGYAVQKETEGDDKLDDAAKSEPAASLKELLSKLSAIFAEKIEGALASPEQAGAEPESEAERPAVSELVSLPQPVLLVAPAGGAVTAGKEEVVPEDDEPVVAYPRQLPSDNEYWAITKAMKDFARVGSVDPLNRALVDVAANPQLSEPVGQRAILDAGALPAILDVLRIRQSQHTSDAAQAVAAVHVLAEISKSPNVRRVLSTEETVKCLLAILRKEELVLMDDLFRTLAHCCHNAKFRDLIIAHKGIEPLIYQIKNQPFASRVCYVLWSLNRNQESTKALVRTHVLGEPLSNYLQNPGGVGEELMLNITRLLYSLAAYDREQAESLTPHQIAFFCHGLQSPNSELVAWCAKAFTVFQIPERQAGDGSGKSSLTDQQRKFGQCEGHKKLVETLSSKEVRVILAGLEAIGCVARGKDICAKVCSGGILGRMQILLKHEDIAVRKSAIKTLGILTNDIACAKWTVKQNLMPDLLQYLHSTDPEFVIYSARAIGSCCSESKNLETLMSQNGVRTLWSLMKSPVSAIQASATRALVPFLRHEQSPSIVRSFVDGLELLVGLLQSEDPEVQASACMAIAEVARDRENLAVMTDLGVVELLSRLLTSDDDAVRKPLADAIGLCANWANNRRRFGERGAIAPLVAYLRISKNKDVHASTAKALKALSEDPENSDNLRRAGVVMYLLEMVESKDSDLQMAAAVAIRNIRTNCVTTDTSDRL